MKSAHKYAYVFGNGRRWQHGLYRNRKKCYISGTVNYAVSGVTGGGIFKFRYFVQSVMLVSAIWGKTVKL